MRIGIFTDTYKPDANGCAQSVEILANNLIKLGNEVIIFCPGKNLTIQKDGNIIRIPGLEAKKFYGYKIAGPIHPILEKEIDDLNLDIIHAETEFGVGTLANIVSYNLNIPRVRTYHTDYVDYVHYFVSKDLGLLYDGAKRIVTLYNKFYGDHCLRLMVPSNKTKKGLLEANIKTRLTVVPNGIELNRFNPKNTSKEKINEIRKLVNVKEDEKLLVYVGRIAEEKNVDLLLKTFKKVKENNVKAKLLVVGLGPSYDKLVKLKDDYKLNDYVYFKGKVEGNDIPAYYHSSDAFISASTSETQGLTYIEALASGLPIIVAKDEVLDCLLTEDENGFSFVDEGSAYESIVKFIKLNNNKINDMKRSAIESSRPYDARAFAKKTLEIYKEVIEEYKASYKIIKTRLKDDIVTLSILNKMGEIVKVNLSVEDYYEKGFRKNTLIMPNVVNDIKNNENKILAYKYALKKLSIKDYSIKNIADAISKKYELSKSELDEIIKKLENSNLLNDENYTISRLSILKESLMSKRAIFKKLLKEGISKDLLEKLYTGLDEDESFKARKKAFKYQQTIKHKSLNAKKQAILTRLINDGFSYDLSKEAVNELDFKNEILEESELIKTEAQKAYNKYKKKYKDYELRNHIYSYLVQKGFKEENIYAAINEMGY